MARHPVQVIAVTGGKGGVGKSNVSVNLAIALAEMGRRVVVLDADLGLANIDILLGISSNKTIENVLTGEGPVLPFAESGGRNSEGALGAFILPIVGRSMGAPIGLGTSCANLARFAGSCCATCPGFGNGPGRPGTGVVLSSRLL